MSVGNTQSDSGRPVPVGPFVREQIVTRLSEALEVARDGLSERFDRFRDLLADVVERVDGIDLLRVPGGDDAEAQPSSRLTVAASATMRGEPVGEFLLIPVGEVVVERPIKGENFVFTKAHAESAKRWFDQMGRKLAIDYEHQSFDRFNTRGDGLRPAAGWIGGLDVREDGLWAVDVTWTDRAGELLRSGEYRYFSPVIFWTDEDHTDVAALGPVALTNDPAMHGVRALAARRELDACEDEETADVSALATEEAEHATRAELEAARSEISLLRKQLAAQEADTFVERGLRLGKILDSTSMDWRADYLRDAEAAEQRLARAPVLLPPGRVVMLDRRGDVERWSAAGASPRHAASALGQSSVEPEDLAAYERAAAAGRVLLTGR